MNYKHSTLGMKKNELVIFSSDLVTAQDGTTLLLMLNTMNMFCGQHGLFYWTITTNQKKMSGLQHQIMMYSTCMHINTKSMIS